MENNNLILLILAALAILLPVTIGFWMNTKIAIWKNKSQTSDELNIDLTNRLAQQLSVFEEVRQEKQVLHDELIRTGLELKLSKQRFEEFRSDVDLQTDRFKNLANEILEEKTKRFDQEQKKGMKEILDPLKEKIEQFEKKVSETDTNAVKRHASLKEQIHLLTQQSESVSKDANNLAKALKGDFKKQGNWGELILESVLNKSGLEKDREYFTQVTERDDHNKMQKPDVVIHLPNNKRLIIDSKVSLVAYDQAVRAESSDDLVRAKKAHLIAVKTHVDTLSAKNYHDLYKMESPDFVLMFVPIDTAFGMALEDYPELYTYAFQKNIVIVTPSTLLATLKTVDTMWQNDRYNRNALQIADEAGKMLDKFVAVVEDMEKLGKQLNVVQSTYSNSMKKLKDGRGNLMDKAHKVMSLGAKASKREKIDQKRTPDSAEL